MKGNDEIKDLFSDKLGGFEAKVNPELWGKVASQIGAGAATTATATGMSLTTKLIIGLGAASVITAGTVVALNSGDSDQKEDVPKTEVAENRVEDKVIEKEAEKDSPTSNDQELSSNYVYTPDPTPSVLPSGPDTDPTPDPDPHISTPGEITLPGTTTPLEPAAIEKLGPPAISVPTPEEVEAEKIPVEDVVTTESKEIEVSFPNIFTPNNDGINDYLFIKNPEEFDASTFSIVVLDDRNKEVYASTDPNFRWNGYSEKRGEMLTEGTYIAIISCKDKDGREAKPVMRMFTIAK